MIKLMPIRLQHLIATMAGYTTTKIPLIESYNGVLTPAYTEDDIGLYCILPKLASLFSLSIETTITLFLYGLPLLSGACGLVGLWLTFTNRWARLVCCSGITALVALALHYQDVYIIYTCVPLSTLPWYLYSRYITKTKSFVSGYFFVTGIVLAGAHYFRAYSSLPVFIFLITALTTQKKCDLRTKMLYLITLFSGVFLVVSYFQQQLSLHNQYVQQQLPHKTPAQSKHVFWHTAYLGFGFLNFLNEDKIQWDDFYGYRTANTVIPETVIIHDEAKNSYTMQVIPYENIMKQKVYELITQQPKFVLYTIFAKLGILLLFLLIFANIGLVYAFLHPKPLWLELSFWSALATSSLFPLLALPIYPYAASFIALATLYGVVSIAFPLDQQR